MCCRVVFRGHSGLDTLKTACPASAECPVSPAIGTSTTNNNNNTKTMTVGPHRALYPLGSHSDPMRRM